MFVKRERIVFDVSGHFFETNKETLNKYPDTLLGDESKRFTFKDNKNNHYFFNRNPFAFESILFFYQSDGKLICPSNLELCHFIEECYFFEIPHSAIQSLHLKNMDNKEKKEILSSLTSNSFRETVWNFLEHPSFSRKAWWFGLLSTSMIAASLVTMCCDTVQELKIESKTFFNNPWFVFELLLNIWFLFEFCARLYFSPNKRKFFGSVLNIIDLIAVGPYFVLLIVNYRIVNKVGSLRSLRTLKLSRIFILTKNTNNLEFVKVVIKEGIHDFFLYITCLIIMVTFGGGILYHVERSNSNSTFTSIPDSMYYALQTLATLGYGDIIPVTITAKIFSCFFIIFGALTLSLPVLSMVSKFTKNYSIANQRMKQKLFKECKKET